MNEIQLVPITLLAMLVTAVMVLQPVLKLCQKLISPVVYVVYVTWQGIITAAERSNRIPAAVIPIAIAKESVA